MTLSPNRVTLSGTEGRISADFTETHATVAAGKDMSPSAHAGGSGAAVAWVQQHRGKLGCGPKLALMLPHLCLVPALHLQPGSGSSSLVPWSHPLPFSRLPLLTPLS